MSQKLRVLHLEDNPGYSELVHSKLDSEGIKSELVRVETREDFEAAVKQGGFDLIIADYFLPTYDGLKALAFAQEQRPDVPILLVSGTIGEEAAIESLRAGATDYVLKHWPERLVPSVRRALRETEERRGRVKAETTLSRREKHFRAISDNSLDIVSVLDREGMFIYNSLALGRVLGYSQAELFGVNAFAYIHLDDLEKVQKDFANTVANPQLTTLSEFRMRHKDGTYRHMQAACRSFLDDPEVAGVVVNSRDVSEKYKAEEALRESEILFHSVWEHSVDGMRLTDENGVILAVNNAFCKLVELKREELEGKVFTVTYLETDKLKEALANYQRRFADRTTARRFEGKLTFHNGKTVEIDGANSFVESRGHKMLLLGLFRDVTEKKQLEQELRQAQKMEAIGQLAGGVAHDFNNILTVIQGHATLLKTSIGTGSTLTGSADQICQAAERAAGLTRQLLTFSRRQMMQPKQLDINQVVSNVTKMLGRILGEDIALQFNYSPNVPLVHADAGMVEQVLLNLAVNSRDAMPAGGQLTIRVSPVELDSVSVKRHLEGREGRFVRLSVSDTGTGIDPKTLPHIFEPFFTTKQIGKGTGLGLATVYGIIKQHQGWIEVESEVGRGTTFNAYFPALGATSSARVDEGTVEEAPARGTETILVVEDEPPVRELVCRILKSAGYKVLEATTGVEALGVWQTNRERIDLLLTDVVMPEGMTGRDLADRLQAEKPKLKAIFTSGYSADIVGKDFVIQEGVNYLQKPYMPTKLTKAVRKCLDGK